jgi:transposase
LLKSPDSVIFEQRAVICGGTVMIRKSILAQGRILSAGLDVDHLTAMVVLLDVASGEIIYEGRLPHDPERWRAFLDRLPDCRVWACYEAGSLGFTLYRTLQALGVEGHVIAPSQVPKAANQPQTKTDRRDALTLAQLYFHPPRAFVRVPSEPDEARRQLTRTREQLLEDKQRVMRRIRSFLITYGIAAPAAKPWSRAYRQHLRDLALTYEELRFTLEVLLDELEAIEAQLERVNERLRQLSQHPDYRAACQRLMTIAGVGPVLAMTFLLELFRPEDFPTAETLAAHVGFTPGEYSSGARIHRGHITHWGSPSLRRLFVEASWTWVRKDPDARQRFQAIRAGKAPKVAIVGMARRLAIAMWAMTVKQQAYAYHWAN